MIIGVAILSSCGNEANIEMLIGNELAIFGILSFKINTQNDIIFLYNAFHQWSSL